MSTPSVSVLMTAFNRDQYVGAAIESVLAQQFGDFELVIVDDCSRDRTREIAEHYASRDSRIRVLVNEHNLGDYPNRNRAAQHARAPLLKYHDSDDIMYPHCLEVMVSAMNAAPHAAAGFSSGHAWPGGACPMLLRPDQTFAREFLGTGVFQCGPGGVILRHSAFAEIGGFRTVGVHSDYLTWFELARRFPIALISGDLFWYRVHDAQELHNTRAARDYANLNGEVWKALGSDGCPLRGTALARARRNQTYTVVKQLMRDFKRADFALAAYRVRHAGLTPLDWLRYLRPPQRSALAGTPQ